MNDDKLKRLLDAAREMCIKYMTAPGNIELDDGPLNLEWQELVDALVAFEVYIESELETWKEKHDGFYTDNTT